jgi:glycosyltransferase involved in cell wall biosynthesis
MKQFVISLSTKYANLCQRVVAPSHSIARLLRERGVMVPIEETPTGVDLAFFKSGNGRRFRQAHAIDPEERVIGHVGRLAPEKNLCYLAEAVASFLDYHHGVFLIVGAGPSEEKIRRIFHKYQLEKRLILAGEHSGRNLADAYNAMDLFVFASKSETQGMVLTEAMAAGQPVIALDASGVREVVTDGLNGRLLDAEAPTELFAEAIYDFFQNPERSGQFRREALRTAETFSRESCARQMVEVYRSMLREHKQASGTPQEFLDWDKLIRALNVEWQLISEKAAATVNAFIETAGKQQKPD